MFRREEGKIPSVLNVVFNGYSDKGREDPGKKETSREKPSSFGREREGERHQRVDDRQSKKAAPEIHVGIR